MGINVRELRDLLNAVPDEHLDLGVSVSLVPEKDPMQMDAEELRQWAWLCQDSILGIVVSFERNPLHAEDPQPDAVSYVVRADEGTLVAEQVETMRLFQQYLDETGGE